MKLKLCFLIAIVFAISISAFAQSAVKPTANNHAAGKAEPGQTAAINMIDPTLAVAPGASSKILLPASRGQQLAQLDAQINAAIEEYKMKRLIVVQRAALESKLTSDQLDALDGPFPTAEGSVDYEWRPRPAQPVPAKTEAKPAATGKGSPN